MNPQNLTPATVTFEQFKQYLISQTGPNEQIYDITNISDDNPIIHEFKPFPTVEIGILPYNDYLQIYLNIGSGFSEDFYSDLHQYHTQLFELLNDYISRTYTEDTDNDPLSFSYLYTPPTHGEILDEYTEGFDLTVRIESIF